MKRSPLPLLVTLLVACTFLSWRAHSDDDPFADLPNNPLVADGAGSEQLSMEIMIAERQLLEWLNDYGPEVARHDYVIDRMIELRAMQAELEFELEAFEMAANLERNRSVAEATAIDELESLRRQAVQHAADQVTILEVDRGRVGDLAAEGVASLAELTNIETQLQAARIALVEQQIALAEIGLRDTAGESEELDNALAQHQRRYRHISEQLELLSRFVEPSLQYRALEQKLARQREALTAWELETVNPGAR